MNERWVEYTGLSLDELKNEGWKKIIHPDDLPNTEQLWKQAIESGHDFEVEDRKRNKDGQYKWHLSRATAFKDDTGKVIMWIGTNTEIEKQKKYSGELEKAISHRTYELQKTNELLEEKNSELQKMNKELESFAYVSSHDLQEPLRKIQTFARIIMEKESQNLTESGKNMFHRMQESAARMQQLIFDLLEFSHINIGERKFEIADLNEVIEDVKQELKEIIEEKKATIEVSEMCQPQVIHFQFRQLMRNLIGNALKFSKQDIPPRILIKNEIVKGIEVKNTELSPEKKYCHITVTDNGIGFKPEYSKKIFEVFQRLHGKDEYAGTGIGLAIVKKIVENHGGLITGQSKPGEGARFDIYIPA